MEIEKELTELIHINNELQNIVSKNQELLRILKLLQEYFDNHPNLNHIEKKWATREAISTLDTNDCSINYQNELIEKGKILVDNISKCYQSKEYERFYFLKTQMIVENDKLVAIWNTIG